MPYINIDENRLQIGAFANQQYENQIEVDCASPSCCHKLKINYQEFQGKEQWELDIEKQAQENNKQYFQEFINKKLQYQSAIYDTEVGFLCGKLTEQEKTTQINLLIALINQAEEVYDQQIGEN